ncbi:hypothetical protein [Corynebacterium timonense]|uniref:Uncharacterized protein n=1 Tax=Corynebacterium timonense TaxID=441500 RepID=A0A1H1LNY8_9CORY|nr:hypothetical protein [Corynebacterium timonense]SDR76087.1 hypothetical protein SAMN04488539_0283 [Corynebacterium timonense]
MPIEHLPARIQPAALRVRAWLLTDAPALVIVGAGLLLRGVTYLPIYFGGPGAGSHPAELLLPIGWWAAIWITVGALCLVSLAVCRLAPISLGLGVGLHAVWAMSFIADAIIDQSPRAWLPAVGYASVALLVVWAVWRGSRDVIPEGAVANELRKS